MKKSPNRCLLDTHAFLWAIHSSDLLSETARTIILDRNNELFLSKVSYWEICLKISRRKLKLKKGWQKLLEAERKANRLHWIEVEPAHCEQIISLPWHHKDPFDRLLIAQATVEKMSIISCDTKFNDYQIKTVW